MSSSGGSNLLTLVFVVGSLGIIYIVSVLTLLRNEFRDEFKKAEEEEEDNQ